MKPSRPEMCIWHFFNHETNTPLKNFGPKIPSETDTIQKISKKISTQCQYESHFLPKIRSIPIRYKKLAKKIRPNTNTIKKGQILDDFTKFYEKTRYFDHFLAKNGQKWAFFGQKWAFFWKNLEKNFLKNLDQTDMTTIFYQYNIDETDMTSIFTNTISTKPIWFETILAQTNTRPIRKKWKKIGWLSQFRYHRDTIVHISESKSRERKNQCQSQAKLGLKYIDSQSLFD